MGTAGREVATIGFKEFLRDRRTYIAVYCASVLLTVGIVQLDLWFSGSSLRLGNALYIGLLGIAGLIVWLIVDFQRQRAFFRQFAKDEVWRSVDELSVLDGPVTREQALYAEAWHRLYGHLRAEVSVERERNGNRTVLITQWAHHMKTPVAVIDLELQKARLQASGDIPDGTPDPSTSTTRHGQILDSIGEENERLKQALHTLLNMIRLDDFAADFKVERVDLVSTVRYVVNEHRRTFITHNVYPKIEQPTGPMVSRGPLHVDTDAKWLKFVLDQIVRNAIQYSSSPNGIRNGDKLDTIGDGGSPETIGDTRSPDTMSDGGKSRGSGNVMITFERGDGETVLEIADDGCGIAREDIGRVFAPFFTGTSGRQHRYSTGMGLYLADETCRRLGHRLTIQSVQGEGTQVRIHFVDDRSLAAGLRDNIAPM